VSSVLVVWAVLAILGLGLAGYGVALWLRIQELRRRGLTRGVVVDNEIVSEWGRLRFRPVVRFHTATGREVRFVGAQSRHRSYVGGSRVVVVYDPDRPDRAAVGTGGAALGYVVTGLAVAGLAVALAVAAGRS
jgi:hypothetical protein